MKAEILNVRTVHQGWSRFAVATVRLAAAGLSPVEAAHAAIALPLTDDPGVAPGLRGLIDTYLG